MTAYIPLGLTGGVNLLDDVRTIRDDQVRKAQNLVPTTPGILAKRKGLGFHQHLFNMLGHPIAFTLPNFPSTLAAIIGVRRMEDSGSLAPSKNTTIYAATGIDTDPYEEYDAGLITTGRPCFVHFNEKTYCFFGPPVVNNGIVIEEYIPNSTGVRIRELDFGSGNSNITPAGACVYRNRLAYWWDNMIALSDTNDPETVGADLTAANGRAFSPGQRDGSKIVACQEVMLTAVGTPAETALLVLTERGGYLITGEPNETADATPPIGDLTVNRISIDVGCSSRETLVTTPYGTIWAGPDDVWLFAQGQVPVRIGSNIRPALQATPADKRYLWHAAYHDGFYRLAVFSQGRGPDDDDPPDDQWWLDLRHGAPRNSDEAMWWGPQRYRQAIDSDTDTPYGVYPMCVESRPGKESLLYGVMQHLVVAAGPTLEWPLRLVSFDSPNHRDICLDLSTEVTDDKHGTYNSEIYIDLLTKAYTSVAHQQSDPLVDKMLQGVEVNVMNERHMRLKCQLIGDEGLTVEECYSDLAPRTFLPGVSLLDSARVSRYSQNAWLRPDSSTRVNAKAWQLRLYDDGVWVVDDNNDAVVISHSTAGTVTVSLTQGAYDKSWAASGSRLLTHIATQLTTESGITFTASATAAGLLQLSAASGTWELLIDESDADQLKCKRVMSSLGFNTDPPLSGANPVVATESSFITNSGGLEIGAMIAMLRAFRRRPA